MDGAGCTLVWLLLKLAALASTSALAQVDAVNLALAVLSQYQKGVTFSDIKMTPQQRKQKLTLKLQ